MTRRRPIIAVTVCLAFLLIGLTFVWRPRKLPSIDVWDVRYFETNWFGRVEISVDFRAKIRGNASDLVVIGNVMRIETATGWTTNAGYSNGSSPLAISGGSLSLPAGTHRWQFGAIVGESSGEDQLKRTLPAHWSKRALAVFGDLFSDREGPEIGVVWGPILSVQSSEP